MKKISYATKLLCATSVLQSMKYPNAHNQTHRPNSPTTISLANHISSHQITSHNRKQLYTVIG